MPELRKDPVVGRWVIISTERGKRPMEYARPEDRGAPRGGFCPFCFGNEDKTPREVFAYRDPTTQPDTSGWKVRVVPNKFPALQIEGELGRRGEGIYDLMNGVGAHEVVIETPDHETTLARMDTSQLVAVLRAYKIRALDLNNDPRFRYIQIFKNRGLEAGASLEHPHTQIIATPIIPKRIVEELRGAEAHYQLKERCIYCDIVNQEIDDGRRIVDMNQRFLSFEPFAPRFPFETWILPRRHFSSFESLPEDFLEDLALLLRSTLARIDQALTEPPYNFVIHTSPCKEPDLNHYHWHLEILPKLTRIAGFEWGSGFFINPTPPELAAQILREQSLGTGEEGKAPASEAPTGS
jgi:UDPglucose--hexose-1-phosphate uridylyltransferase